MVGFVDDKLPATTPRFVSVSESVGQGQNKRLAAETGAIGPWPGSAAEMSHGTVELSARTCGLLQAEDLPANGFVEWMAHADFSL
jgi:hypothetical protein